jgi:hypothetical protein
LLDTNLASHPARDSQNERNKKWLKLNLATIPLASRHPNGIPARFVPTPYRRQVTVARAGKFLRRNTEI